MKSSYIKRVNKSSEFTLVASIRNKFAMIYKQLTFFTAFTYIRFEQTTKPLEIMGKQLIGFQKVK